jgi:hypothetical protein
MISPTAIRVPEPAEVTPEDEADREAERDGGDLVPRLHGQLAALPPARLGEGERAQ